MKKLTKDMWIKIALSLLGVLAAILVYVPNYALVDQGLKGRCAIFFIIAIVLLWLPMELKSSIFALNFYYELLYEDRIPPDGHVDLRTERM